MLVAPGSGVREQCILSIPAPPFSMHTRLKLELQLEQLIKTVPYNLKSEDKPMLLEISGLSFWQKSNIPILSLIFFVFNSH